MHGDIGQTVVESLPRPARRGPVHLQPAPEDADRRTDVDELLVPRLHGHGQCGGGRQRAQAGAAPRRRPVEPEQLVGIGGRRHAGRRQVQGAERTDGGGRSVDRHVEPGPTLGERPGGRRVTDDAALLAAPAEHRVDRQLGLRPLPGRISLVVEQRRAGHHPEPIGRLPAASPDEAARQDVERVVDRGGVGPGVDVGVPSLRQRPPRRAPVLRVPDAVGPDRQLRRRRVASDGRWSAVERRGVVLGLPRRGRVAGPTHRAQRRTEAVAPVSVGVLRDVAVGRRDVERQTAPVAPRVLAPRRLTDAPLRTVVL